MDNQEILIKAVKERKLISFSYKNQPSRRGAPHAIYFSPLGNKNFDVYQFDGYSSSGNIPNWRIFLLRKVSNLKILNEEFEVAEGYNPDSSKYNRLVNKI